MNQYKYDKKRLQKYMPQLRGCAGMSTEVLAEKVGLTKQAISYIETHQDKPMTKMQYISIRAAFDEEYQRNPENINLRDCYDLVFSDPKFFKENKERIEYALYQAVEDTKIQRRKMRAAAKKKAAVDKQFNVGAATLGAAESLAGSTAATIAIGGIAAATFPFMFPLILAGGAAAIGGSMMGDAIAEESKEQEPKELNKSKKKKTGTTVDRASRDTKHPQWMQDALNTNEKEDSE